MALWLKQSTAVDVPIGPFVDSTDGNTAESGLTLTQPDIRLKKNGGNWAQKNAAQTLSHEEAGWYELSLDATDTNTLGHLVVAVHESGALPVWREFLVVPANVYDSLVAGSDVLDANAAQLGGTAQTGRDIGTSVLLSSGTGTGQVSLSGGTVTLTDASLTAAKIGADALTGDKIAPGAIAKGDQLIGLNDLSAAAVNTEVDTALSDYDGPTHTELLNMVRVMLRKDSALATDLSALLTSINADLGSGGGAYANTTDSQEAIRDKETDIETDTQDIQSRLPAALVSGRMDASIGAAAANTLTASALAADAVTEIQSGLALEATSQTIKSTTDKLDDTLEDDGGTYRFTTNALEQAPTGGSAPSAATIADAVWDEARADHVSAGSFGQGVASVQGNVTGSTASVTGNVGGNVSGSIGSLATQAKTDVNAEVDTALADYDSPTNAEMEARTLVAANYATAATQTTILNRLGSWAGSARNTVLGAFQALLRKDSDASVPSDINADLGSGNGAANNTTDSLEAIRDRGDAAWTTANVSALALQSSVDDLEGRLTAQRAANLDNLDAAVSTRATPAQVNTEADTALADVGLTSTITGRIDAAVSTRATPAQVNAEVVDCLNVDTYAEPGQEAPGATISLARKISYLFKAWRNKHTQTATEYKLFADDASTVDQKATVSDDNTTLIRSEVGTGA